jgi:thioredoxin 1
MGTSELTQANFEAILTRVGIVMVDAWAGWCGPCRAFAPLFEAASLRHPDVLWAKLDTEKEQELSGAMGIRALPTLLVFRDGILLFQQAGMLPASALDDLVKQARAIDMDMVRQKLAEHERAEPQSQGGRAASG